MMDMGKTLIIAEKPSVAIDLAKVIGRFDRKDGCLENDQYVVSWAFGHLVELAEPEDYDPCLKKWGLESLPILPESFRMQEISSGRKQLAVLKKLLRSKDISGVVNACDAGREGELIFRRIYQAAQSDKPVKRLWLSEATPAAVKEAFHRLRSSRELDSLAAAAEARSQADWIVGINATRAYTCRHSRLLSLGRVPDPDAGAGGEPGERDPGVHADAVLGNMGDFQEEQRRDLRRQMVPRQSRSSENPG
jgi:DNA topoisomerase-3